MRVGRSAMTNKQTGCAVLHVCYYPSLLHTRQRMMEADGHLVTSALGNDDCKAIASKNDFDVVVVGFSASWRIGARSSVGSKKIGPSFRLSL